MLSKLYTENVGILSGEGLEKESPDTLNDKAFKKQFWAKILYF